MRVAFVSLETNTRLPPGGERRPELLVRAFESSDLSVEPFTTTSTADDGWSRVGRWSLPGTIRGLNPDVVHVIGGRGLTATLAALGARVGADGLVLELLSVDTPPGFARRTATAHVVPSELVATPLREAGVADSSITIVPPPVDVSRLRGVKPARDLDIVATSRFDADGNVEDLLLALGQLRRRDWTATVLGDGPRRERCVGLARDLRIDDRVRFPGRVPLEGRLARYRGAHVYVQTARRCETPIELARALVAGCVGVIEYHENSCAPELIAGRERGIRVTSGDSLAAAIEEAGSFEHLTLDSAAVATFGEEAVTDSYRTVYESVLEV